MNEDRVIQQRNWRSGRVIIRKNLEHQRFITDICSINQWVAESDLYHRGSKKTWMIGISSCCSSYPWPSLFTEDTTLSYHGISFMGFSVCLKMRFPQSSGLVLYLCFTLPKSISIFYTFVVFSMALIPKPIHQVLLRALHCICISPWWVHRPHPCCMSDGVLSLLSITALGEGHPPTPLYGQCHHLFPAS